MRNSKIAKAQTLAEAKFEAGEYPKNLLGQNSKTLKSEKVFTDHIQLGLQLAPANMSGYNLCPYSTPECERDCLAFSGHGGDFMHEAHQKFNPLWAGWILKSLILQRDPDWFFGKLLKEIDQFRARTQMGTGKLSGKKLVIRLNVTSDIVWERKTIPANAFHQAGMLMPAEKPTLFNVFPEIQFLDYTKIPRQYRQTPPNYFLLLSHTGANLEACLQYLAEGGNVAAVFDNKVEEYLGFPTVDGDTHDLRHLDPPGHWVMLKPKGTLNAHRIDNPFVIRPQDPGGLLLEQTG